MGAAQYVGRVGGLAVALGVGLAIFLSGGTASADTGDTSPTRPSSTSTSDRDSDSKQRNNIKITSSSRDSDDTKRSPTRDSSKHSSDTSEHDSEKSGEQTPAPPKRTISQLRATTAPAATPDQPDPDPPAADPTALLVPTATRREVAAPYDPAIGLVDGVITGTNSSEADNLTYTVVRNPSAGGKVSLDADTGDFTFLPYLSPSREVGSERFSVLVAQQTAFTQALQNIEIVKQIAPRILVVLQQVPIVKDLLSPLIGRAERFDLLVDVAPYVGAGQAPIAFTTKITSFDGTRISVNFFPKAGLEFGEVAPTVLNGPSLATAGYIDLSQLNTVSGLVPGISQIRDAGYNVITWDPRGEFASGGLMHLDSELFEARDVSAILDWAARQPGVKTETPGDPLVGMVGGSYGGGIQLTSAGIDRRIDAIAPGIAWNSLETALYPNHAFKTSWASLLALSLALTGSRPDPEVYAGILTGLLTGFLTPGQRRFLSENSPDTVVDQITVPTFFLQGTVDGLFVLQQALDNAEQLDDNVTVRMIWYCGGHGYCLDLNQQQSADQYAYLNAQTLAWMDTYVKNKGESVPVTGPTFMWVDQKGNWFSADNLPIPGSDFFSDDGIELSGAGGLLPIVPIVGGSGPQTQAPFPLSLPAAADSRHALELEIPNQGGNPIHVVGAPKMTLTYSGLGTSRNIYAQLVDNKTGRVLGNVVTPVPVTLDGREHTVTIDLENIAYTMGANDSLTLQIVDSATAYEDFTSFGIVNVTNVGIVLPTAAQAVPVTLPQVPLLPTGPTGPPSVEDMLTGTATR
ncbi:MAG: CocE/NonD family hydrolase [Mycobacterium sp.]